MTHGLVYDFSCCISSLHILIYINVQDKYASYTTTYVEEMVNLWLVDHHGYIKLYDKYSIAPPKDTRVAGYKSVSKVGETYPRRRI